jgi:phenylpyruvate tautomerase PptA (4-oxalocrotonate tautomerase family)
VNYHDVKTEHHDTLLTASVNKILFENDENISIHIKDINNNLYYVGSINQIKPSTESKYEK